MAKQQQKQPETAAELQQQQQQIKTEQELAAATEAAMKNKEPLTTSPSSKNEGTQTAIRELTQSLNLVYQRTDALAALMEQERKAMVAEREEYQTARMAVDVQIEGLQEVTESLQEAAATLVILTQQLARI